MTETGSTLNIRNTQEALMDDVTAYHEAGHAVMAYHVGAVVESMTIDPDWDDGPERYGDLCIRWKDSATTKRGIENRIRVALAGPVAEMIYTGEPFHPSQVAEWAADWQQACQLVSVLVSEPTKRMRQLESTTLEIFRSFQREDLWSALAAIADNLLAHETLEEEEITDIIANWLD